MPPLADFTWILLQLALLAFLVRAIVRASAALHILQLEGYKSGRFVGWLYRHPRRVFEGREALFIGGWLLLTLGLTALGIGERLLPLLILGWLGLNVFLVVRRPQHPAKKPLVYTARAKRLFGLAILLLVAGVIGSVLLSGGFSLAGNPLHTQFLILLPVTLALSQLVALPLTLANGLLFPVERSIHAGYLRSARRRIQQLQPKVIAITGSYGKTSTKYILNTILARKFQVLMTPDSYNTPMGICKVIRGQLESKHELFIVEMGAYKRGEIRQLAKLVSPQIGILTAVGPQHLERFKTLENIARTKYELIESLPPDGTAVFNDDNEICSELADKTPIRVVRYAVDRLDAKVALTARQVQNTSAGLTFVLETQSGETSIVQTKLLGKNNVSNLLAAAAVALECGMSLDEIRQAAARIEPIPHRLQLIPGTRGVTVIDDGFNANPMGAQAALEVLASFEQGRKVLVTPGMVELGDLEVEQNRIFGTQAAEVCDFVLLVGPQRTQPILQGLQDVGFPKEKTILVESLAEATTKLEHLLKPGDVVLFENDLPDSYSEDV